MSVFKWDRLCLLVLFGFFLLLLLLLFLFLLRFLFFGRLFLCGHCKLLCCALNIAVVKSSSGLNSIWNHQVERSSSGLKQLSKAESRGSRVQSVDLSFKSSRSQESSTCLECGPNKGGGIGSHTKSVQRLVTTLVCHVVTHKTKVPGIHRNSINAKHRGNLLDYSSASCLNTVGLEDRVDIVTFDAINIDGVRQLPSFTQVASGSCKVGRVVLTLALYNCTAFDATGRTNNSLLRCTFSQAHHQQLLFGCWESKAEHNASTL
mmetsp:Transcript_2724/g.4562  ORF Transcript_2724/g.4562 Transcript_2724/m.4562 type:complete len:262 (-) Transcript_2724:2464-3249(-)